MDTAYVYHHYYILFISIISILTIYITSRLRFWFSWMKGKKENYQMAVPIILPEA